MLSDLQSEKGPANLISLLGKPEFKQVPLNEGPLSVMRALVCRFIESGRFSGSKSLSELAAVSRALLLEARLPLDFLAYGMVLLGNEIERKYFVEIPTERRLLLLPFCLRDSEKCKGDVRDEQLVCAGCNRCPMGPVKREAEGLGYTVLIAEDMSLIYETIFLQRVGAVVGVACLDRLLEVFPLIAEKEIHGIAVPLLRNGCKDTAVNPDAILEAVRLGAISPWAARLSTEAPGPMETRLEPREPGGRLNGNILAHLGEPLDITENIAFDWVKLGGKRIRALIVIHLYSLLAATGNVPESIAKVALAVEIFHKASLVHDDIEDDEMFRYGQPALHRRYSLPVALNVGDYLIGKGYDLLTSVAPQIGVEQSLAIIRLFSSCHLLVARGQGEELFWDASTNKYLDVGMVIRVYSWKTAQFFKLSILAGIILSGGDFSRLEPLIDRFSKGMGIAYQILDDLTEARATSNNQDVIKAKPTLLYALALKHSSEKDRAALLGIFSKPERTKRDLSRVRDLYQKYGVPEKAREMAYSYYSEAKSVLEEMRGDRLSGVLENLIEYRIRMKLENLTI